MRPSSYLFLGLVLSGTAHAQQQLDVVDGPLLRDGFGTALADLGDLNGDGFRDVLVGAPGPFLGASPSGLAYVLSGADRSVLLTVLGSQSNDRFGGAVAAAGDVNGDGTTDFIVGAVDHDGSGPQTGRATVHSGADGSLLHEFTGVMSFADFGDAVDGVGDVDGDGFVDLAVGSPFEDVPLNANGRVRIYSGLDGSLLHGSHGATAFAAYGSAVRGIGDVDGDGLSDVAIAARSDSTAGPSAGSVTVLAGGTFATLRTLHPPPGSTRFGLGLQDVADVDGDGARDLLVLTLRDAAGPPLGGVPPEFPPSVTLYSGATGALVYRVFPPVDPPDESPTRLSVLGDVDGDGVEDWCAGLQSGAVGTFSGALLVHSGVDGRLLFRIDGELEFGKLWVACAAGDLDGDGLGDFVAGSPHDGHPLNVPRRGRIQVFRGGPPPVDFTDLCNGDGGDQLGCTSCPCGNDAPAGTVGGCLGSGGVSARLSGSGDPAVSLPAGGVTDVRFALAGARPSSLAILRSGTVVPPADASHPCFGEDSGTRAAFLDGLRCVSRGRTLHGARAVDVNGDVGILTPPWGGEGAPAGGLAADGVYRPGMIRYFQAWYRDDPFASCTQGVNTTQAVVVRFVP